nr:MAG TPA: hypothetical protein [Caudoviricetes sp.]
MKIGLNWINYLIIYKINTVIFIWFVDRPICRTL